MVITTPEKAAELGAAPFARFKSCAVAGADPRKTHLTVPAAVNKALKAAGMTIDQMALIEIQEAFAAQVLADLVHMKVGTDEFKKVNVNGSGISLGHPIACTGTLVLFTLLHEMRRSGKKHALECICGGGGLGIAAVLKSI